MTLRIISGGRGGFEAEGLLVVGAAEIHTMASKRSSGAAVEYASR